MQDSEEKQLQEVMCAKGTLPCSFLECILLETALTYPTHPILHPSCEGRRGSCRSIMFIHHSPGMLQLPDWGPFLSEGKNASWKQCTFQDYSQSKPYFLVHGYWLSLLSLLPTPTASACGLRSHHLKNSIAHLLHSSTAPWGRTPDGGDKSTRSWLLARGFFLN